MSERPIEGLLPEMILSESVVGEQGMIFLQKGTPLTPHYIQRLRALGIRSVRIEPEKSEQPPDDESQHSESSHLHASIRRARTAIVRKGNYRKSSGYSYVERRIQLLAQSDQLEGRMLQQELEERYIALMEACLTYVAMRPPLIRELARMWHFAPYLLEHALGTATYAGMLGTALGYTRRQLQEVVEAALLCNVGMTELPRAVVLQELELTPRQHVHLRMHPLAGKRRLGKIRGLSEEVRQCALLHHERYDGGGYPIGLKGGEIPELVQLVAISDVYNSLISSRPYRPAFSHLEAAELLYAAGNYYFSIQTVQLFFQTIAIYRMDDEVKLSNGLQGVILSSATGVAHRPIVRVVKDERGRPLATSYDINLADTKDLYIVE